MKVYNRSAFTVTAKKPFIDWINRLDPKNPLKIRVLGESSTYLTKPDFTDAAAHLKKYHKEIFELELESMWTDEEDWPENITLELFHEWFSVEISNWVYDLSKKPLNS